MTRARRDTYYLPDLHGARTELSMEHGWSLPEAKWFVDVLEHAHDNLARVTMLGAVHPTMTPDEAREFLTRHGWLEAK
jgi:hypothetical protein